MGDLSVAPWSPFRGLVIGTVVRQPLPWELGRVTLTFDVSFAFDEEDPLVSYGPEVIRNTVTSLRWDSDCDCLGIGAVVATDRSRPGFDLVNVVVDIARLGEVVD
jgi:hypothetical protein